MTVDDQIIAYPSTMQSYMVFANTDLLAGRRRRDAHRRDDDWDELREIAQATTTADTYGLGWGLSSPTAAMMSLRWASTAGTSRARARTPRSTSAPTRLAVPELVHQMAYEDKSLDPTSLTQSGSDVLASFYGGRPP